MIDLLKKIYHQFSDYAIIRWFGRMYLHGFPVGNLLSYLRLRRLVIKAKSEEKKEFIHVIFLAQNTSVWYKSESIYQAMKGDDTFHVDLVVIPDITDESGEETYQYFEEIYSGVHRAGKNGELCDLKNMKPDYVFYTRPYDSYLPAEYRSNKVSRYAKTCYCSYSFCMRLASLVECMPRLFFRNIYLFFAESEYIKLYNRKRFVFSYRKYRKSEFVGYPIMDRFRNIGFGNDTTTFLWTPRWSTAKEVGGSNFFVYKDLLVDYVMEHEGLELIFRPHPLTFFHLQSTGQMTAEEVATYCFKYDETDRLCYDKKADYVDSFREANVLISDPSSMIFEWYTTGKPIIFCTTDTITVFELMPEAMEGCYIANNWDELRNIMEQLNNGNDPLKQKREQISKELFGSDIKNAGQNVADYIKRDYYN